MKKLYKLRIWWMARVKDWPFYRVTYPDGRKTIALHRAEAIGLRDVFGGNMWLDYKRGDYMIKYIKGTP